MGVDDAETSRLETLIPILTSVLIDPEEAYPDETKVIMSQLDHPRVNIGSGPPGRAD